VAEEIKRYRPVTPNLWRCQFALSTVGRSILWVTACSLDAALAEGLYLHFISILQEHQEKISSADR
jgi:hypothetical protein